MTEYKIFTDQTNNDPSQKVREHLAKGYDCVSRPFLSFDNYPKHEVQSKRHTQAVLEPTATLKRQTPSQNAISNSAINVSQYMVQMQYRHKEGQIKTFISTC
ncbi:MAG: hypothetical protein P8M25_10060 [Paracoccaceae bacterium]|nr:hypothetical protein [Paracoccaceae bacterium]